jgi:hypothetical protein
MMCWLSAQLDFLTLSDRRSSSYLTQYSYVRGSAAFLPPADGPLVLLPAAMMEDGDRQLVFGQNLALG